MHACFAATMTQQEYHKNNIEKQYQNQNVWFRTSNLYFGGLFCDGLFFVSFNPQPSLLAGGAECVYCLTSAAISFTLFAIGFSGLSPKETGRTAPALIAVYAVTVLSLSVVLGGAHTIQAHAPIIRSPLLVQSHPLTHFVSLITPSTQLCSFITVLTKSLRGRSMKPPHETRSCLALPRDVRFDESVS